MNTTKNRLIQKLLLNKKGKKQNGFTLIELMVVIAIVGVLSAVGLPQLLKAQDRAKISVAQQEAVNYAKECSISILTGAATPDGGQYTTLGNQTCAAGTAVTSSSQTTPPVTFTVAMLGGIPGKPISSETTAAATAAAIANATDPGACSTAGGSWSSGDGQCT
jgi:type IV pilus assembly protein PilA